MPSEVTLVTWLAICIMFTHDFPRELHDQATEPSLYMPTCIQVCFMCDDLACVEACIKVRQLAQDCPWWQCTMIMTALPYTFVNS